MTAEGAEIAEEVEGLGEATILSAGKVSRGFETMSLCALRDLCGE
jgi:hypothetical protein